MSIIKNTFQELKKLNKKAFIPFITAGDSGLNNTFKLMQTLVVNGADMIELGVPFSDPMADGPVIVKSHERAVANGVSLHNVLDLVKKFRQTNKTTAVVLMGYLNPIEVFGYQEFADTASQSGVDGVLVIDMPPEEAQDLKAYLDNVDIDFIFLVAPTTTDERLASLANIASGFVYFVSLKGVTGASHLDIDIVNINMIRIRQFINLPIGVGFGIKDVTTAKMVSKIADAVIVGSSLVTFVEKYNKNKDKMLVSVGELADDLSKAIKE